MPGRTKSRTRSNSVPRIAHADGLKFSSSNKKGNVASAEELAKLEARAYELRYSEWEKWLWEFAQESGHVFAASDKDGLIGAAMLLPTMSGALYLETMVVDPRSQCHGIGTMLLKKVVAFADANQKPLALHVKTGSRAIHLYRRFGFTEKGRPTYRYYPDVLYQQMTRKPTHTQ